MSESRVTRPFKWVSRGAIGVLAVGLAVAGIIIACLVWPYEPVTVESPISVEKDIYFAGETLRVTTDYCNPGYDVETVIWLDSYAPSEFPENDVGPRISSALVDSLYAYGLEGIPPCNSAPVEVLIESSRSPGIYKLRAESTWRVNPIRIEQVTTETEPFRVEKP